MWLFSRKGFYSIVENFDIDGHFLVRSRVKADMEELLLSAGIDKKPSFKNGTDYEFRVTVSQAELTRIFVELERSIDYSNFKAAIGEIPRQRNRATLYGEIWWLVKQSLVKQSLAKLGRVR